MKNANFNSDKKTTILGIILLFIGLMFYTLDLVIVLKKDINNYVNSGMIISGVLLIISPDKWIDLITQYVKSLFSK